MLFHFTPQKESILAILREGFAFLPCDRHLRQQLFEELVREEPQNTKMVCFTECFEAARLFGDYGVAVSKEWVINCGGKPVRYVDETEYETLRQEIRMGFNELNRCIKHPEDGFLKLAFRDKGFAKFLGVPQYAEFLEKYEFMQTSNHKEEKEWRVTQKLPNYSSSRVLPTVGGWGFINFLPVPITAINYLITVTKDYDWLRRSLSVPWKNLPIKRI